LIVLLVVANATWSGLCVFTAAVLAGTVSMFGLTHLVGEGVFVGGLAALESIRPRSERARCWCTCMRPAWGLA
jgi:hypothetical protein